MTLDEFIAYLAPRLKESHVYEEEEINEICYNYRRTLCPKDWVWLSEKLACGLSSDALRKRASRREKKLEKQNGDYLEQTEHLFIARQKLRDEATSYRRAMRDYTRVEELKEILIEAVDDLPRLPEPVVSERVPTEQEAVLMFSDLHVGVEVDEFYNKYDLKEARERVRHLIADTKTYCALFRPKVFNFINLGDLVHGLIHTNARIETTQDVVSQIINASEIVAWALNELANVAPVVTYRSVIDNHSRMVANKNESIEKENLGRIIDWYLKERLKNTPILFLDNDLNESIGTFTLNNGKIVAYAHGHEDAPDRAFQHFIGATNKVVNYVLLGHYHKESTKFFQNLKVFVNGSIVGTDQYAMSKRLFTEPSQTLLFFDKSENVINISIKLGKNVR
jgi:hypothetical protein